MYFFIEKVIKDVFGIDQVSFSLEIFLYQENRLKFNNFRKIVTYVFLHNKKSSNKFDFLLHTSFFCYIRLFLLFMKSFFLSKRDWSFACTLLHMSFFWIWSYENAFSDQIPIIPTKPLKRTPLKTPIYVKKNFLKNLSHTSFYQRTAENWVDSDRNYFEFWDFNVTIYTKF